MPRRAAGALLRRVGGQRLKPVGQIDTRRRWWWWDRIRRGQQPIQHRLAVLGFRVEKAGEQANTDLHGLARRCGSLLLQVIAKLFLDLVRFEFPPRDAFEQMLIAAERPRRQLPGLRRQVLKTSAPFSRL